MIYALAISRNTYKPFLFSLNFISAILANSQDLYNRCLSGQENLVKFCVFLIECQKFQVSQRCQASL